MRRGRSSPSDSREEVSPGEPVPPLLVKPPAALEGGGHPRAGVGDLHLVQQPARVVAAAVVLHAYFAQLTQVQRLQEEVVSASPLEEVSHFLRQLPLARVPIGPKDGHKDVGIGAGPWLVACCHDDLILDWHQALDLAGKGLSCLGDFEYLEVLLLPLEGDEAITVKEVPGGGGEEAQWAPAEAYTLPRTLAIHK